MLKFWNPEDKLFLLKVFVFGFGAILISKLIDAVWLATDYVVLKTIIVLLFKESGVALMIAAVLGYTVEERTRAKQTQELSAFTQQVSEDVLSAVFKKIIPDSIFAEVKRTVLDETLLKRDATLRYDLKAIDGELQEQLGLNAEDAEHLLICHITTTHTLVNLGDNEIPNHKVRFGVDCDLHENLVSKIDIHTACVGTAISSEDLPKYIDDGNGKGMKEFSKEVTLKPKEEITVSFSATTFKRIEDAEIWNTLKPTENMEVIITHPSGIKVGARALHSRTLEKLPTNPKACRAEYKLQHGVFPFQGITFWWVKDGKNQGACN